VSKVAIIREIEAEYMKKDLPSFNIGDTICVNTRIVEGEKERVQAFTGTVVAKKGYGASETFTVYRTAYGSSMDRVFLLHSPRITSIEVIRSGKVRRAKLYYLQGLSGKAAKVREQYVAGSSNSTTEAAAAAQDNSAPQ
jgi:large subunit ribosomal protein L19